MNVLNIYSGPIWKVKIGSYLFDALGNDNGGAEITWEPRSYELNNGDARQMAGLGKVRITLAESDTTTINNLKSLLNSLQNIEIRFNPTGSDYDYWQINNILLSMAIKRGFGDEPHTVTITGQKYTTSANAFASKQHFTQGAQ